MSLVFCRCWCQFRGCGRQSRLNTEQTDVRREEEGSVSIVNGSFLTKLEEILTDFVLCEPVWYLLYLPGGMITLWLRMDLCTHQTPGTHMRYC